MGLPGRNDATAAAWQQEQEVCIHGNCSKCVQLRAHLAEHPEPRRGTDLSMEVEPPLDEHDPEPFTTAWRLSSPHAHRSMKVDEQGYDAWGTWVPGGAA